MQNDIFVDLTVRMIIWKCSIDFLLRFAVFMIYFSRIIVVIATLKDWQNFFNNTRTHLFISLFNLISHFWSSSKLKIYYAKTVLRRQIYRLFRTIVSSFNRAIFLILSINIWRFLKYVSFLECFIVLLSAANFSSYNELKIFNSNAFYLSFNVDCVIDIVVEVIVTEIDLLLNLFKKSVVWLAKFDW